MSTELKVGICGLGERIAHVARCFVAHNPAFKIVAYVDPTARSCGQKILADSHISIGVQYRNLEEMLTKDSLDLLMIGSPNIQHFEHILTGLQHGIRVFTEKPVVVSEQQTYDLVQQLAQTHVDNVLVGLVLRYSPLYRDFIRLQQSGILGDIISMEGSEHLSPDHGGFFMRNWRRYEKLTGGYMLEKCCHDLDLYQGLINARPIRVASFGGRGFYTPANAHLEEQPIYHQRPSGWSSQDKVFASDADIVDNQTAIIEYESGVSLSFHSNLHAASKSRRICAIGSKGMVEGDFERNSLKAYDALSRACVYEKSYDFDPNAGHYGSEERMVKDICDHLFEGSALPVNIVDALVAGLTAIKIDEARKSGAVVSLAGCWEQFDQYLPR